MSGEGRDKKKFFEVISKYRIYFALAGGILAIIAFFMPTFYKDRINSQGDFITNSLFLFTRVCFSNEGVYTCFDFNEYQECIFPSTVSIVSLI